MTAAHLILVWEERDDPNLLRHAERAKKVGRNPHVVEYEPVVRAERLVLRVGGGRPAGARHPQASRTFAGFGRYHVGVEEELFLVDARTAQPRAARARRSSPAAARG